MQDSALQAKEWRLDLACVELGLVQTRNQAHTLIKKGKICVNGNVCLKNAQKVSTKDKITALEPQRYISRAGEKLDIFLNRHPKLLSLCGISALDIGSSTGGFSGVLLQRGVGALVCVDVGRGQLHESLRQDERVRFYEGTDIRDFARQSDGSFELVLCDVSFISIHKILESLKKLSRGIVILLFKPQFEVGKEAKRNKRGVLMESQSTKRALEQTLSTLERDFRILVCEESQVLGKEGNREFFIACQKL